MDKNVAIPFKHSFETCVALHWHGAVISNLFFLLQLSFCHWTTPTLSCWKFSISYRNINPLPFMSLTSATVKSVAALTSQADVVPHDALQTQCDANLWCTRPLCVTLNLPEQGWHQENWIWAQIQQCILSYRLNFNSEVSSTWSFLRKKISTHLVVKMYLQNGEYRGIRWDKDYE